VQTAFQCGRSFSNKPDFRPVVAATIAFVTDAQTLQVEGRLQVTEITGAWGAYAGERIMIGPGQSLRDDLGVKIHELFEEGAAEALRDGRSPSERFELPSVRITIRTC
jgi:hypothetical protein